jgi:hypothetical protein
MLRNNLHILALGEESSWRTNHPEAIKHSQLSGVLIEQTKFRIWLRCKFTSEFIDWRGSVIAMERLQEESKIVKIVKKAIRHNKRSVLMDDLAQAKTAEEGAEG